MLQVAGFQIEMRTEETWSGTAASGDVRACCYFLTHSM